MYHNACDVVSTHKYYYCHFTISFIVELSLENSAQGQGTPLSTRVGHLPGLTRPGHWVADIRPEGYGISMPGCGKRARGLFISTHAHYLLVWTSTGNMHVLEERGLITNTMLSPSSFQKPHSIQPLLLPT